MQLKRYIYRYWCCDLPARDEILVLWYSLHAGVLEEAQRPRRLPVLSTRKQNLQRYLQLTFKLYHPPSLFNNAPLHEFQESASTVVTTCIQNKRRRDVYFGINLNKGRTAQRQWLVSRIASSPPVSNKSDSAQGCTWLASFSGLAALIIWLVHKASPNLRPLNNIPLLGSIIITTALCLLFSRNYTLSRANVCVSRGLYVQRNKCYLRDNRGAPPPPRTTHYKNCFAVQHNVIN